MTPEQITALKAQLAENPGVLFESLAEEHNASEAQMIECLPEDFWTKIDGAHFQTLLKEVATWGKVTTIIHSSGSIFEFSGPFPEGSVAHGYYNLSHESGLSGHLKFDNCDAIYFIERPFRGSATYSMLLTDLKGRIMFKIFLGRDENRVIFPDQIEKFHALAKAFN
ncbi:heme utilization cystosolic carrier protein HutX [Wohlfahrtiimonas chitiniclastica]|uniref:Heme utilization cystosolic carrier protein HutX n=1 Tax=Wohlfahrtiimonas chitiniclastica TaxID=400946 RepID=A0AB35BXP0_9GAMM|nr:heme utilization cystosolic carrier protein HutX [Wohlfahrtiimonas chitiniclastica]MBS7823647.1 heme utilization cystosolic carrier protein HutX [Wohlfahrtiimonas chitiniclastica]MBS7839265.1 heme utilization cystosolic carrier protein HutX [Wohlfahrtiimonas chitiniclastica]